IADEFRDGVHLVELAQIRNSLLVPMQVVRTLGLQQEHQQPIGNLRTIRTALSDYLSGKQMLLLLNDCEHLIEGCVSLVDGLLGACPGLKILASSREALNVRGETIWNVPPLRLPKAPLSLTPEQILEYEAIELFVMRTQAVQPDFRLTAENLGIVTQL